MGKIEVRGHLLLDDRRSAQVRAPCGGAVADLPSVADVAKPRVVLVFTSTERMQAQQRFLASKFRDAQPLVDLGMDAGAVAWIEANSKPIVQHKLSCPKGHVVQCSVDLGQQFGRGERLFLHGSAMQARCYVPDELAAKIAPRARARLYPEHWFGGAEFIDAQVADIRGCWQPRQKEVILDATGSAVHLPLVTALTIFIEVPTLQGRRRVDDLLAAQDDGSTVRPPQIVRGANRPLADRMAEALKNEAQAKAAAAAARPPDPVPDRPKPAPYEPVQSTKRTRSTSAKAADDEGLTRREWERARITTIVAMERALRPSATVLAVLAVRVMSDEELSRFPDPFRSPVLPSHVTDPALSADRLEVRLSAEIWARLSRADIEAEIHQPGQPVIQGVVSASGVRTARDGSLIVQLSMLQGVAGPQKGGSVWLRLRSAEAVGPCLSVPRSAVLQTEGRSQVLLHVAPGRLVPADVSIGMEADGWIEVRTGLKAGQAVAFDIAETVRAAAQTKEVTAASARAEDRARIRSGRNKR